MKLPERIVKKIIKDISERIGLQEEWQRIDKGTRQEIIEKWEGIVEKEIKECLSSTKKD